MFCISCPVRLTIGCSVFGECTERSCGTDSERLTLRLLLTDAIVPCRRVQEDGKDKNSVVSFSLTDEPRHVDLVTSNSKDEVEMCPHVTDSSQLISGAH